MHVLLSTLIESRHSLEDRSTGIDQLCVYVLGGDIYYMYMYSYTCRDIVHVTVLYMYMYNVCSHTCREMYALYMYMYTMYTF